MLWDDTNLYVGYWIEEPFVEATLTERDAPIYKNNDVELFIAGRDAYYEFEINSFGTIYEVLFVWERAFESSGLARRPEFDRSAGVRPFNGFGFTTSQRPPLVLGLDLPARDGVHVTDHQHNKIAIAAGPWSCHPVAFARAAGDGGWARPAAARRRRVADGLLALQPVQGSPAGKGSGRLGVEPARRVGLAHAGAVHPGAVLDHAGRTGARGTAMTRDRGLEALIGDELAWSAASPRKDVRRLGVALDGQLLCGARTESLLVRLERISMRGPGDRWRDPDVLGQPTHARWVRAAPNVSAPTHQTPADRARVGIRALAARK